MKRIVLAAASLAMILFAAAARAADKPAFEIVPVWFHVHTNFHQDDGGETPEKIKNFIVPKGYRGIVFAPHSQDIDFPGFRAAVDAINTPDFIAVPGREISTLVGTTIENLIMCHLNAVSTVENPKDLDNKFTGDELPKVIAELDAEGAFYVWNHPWTCRQWEPRAATFDGIEFFNDFGAGYASGESYAFDKKVYFDALKSGKKVFAIGGIDMHTLMQATLGDFATYVFPDRFERDTFIDAFRAGHTIAAFNAKIESLSARPAFEPAAVGADGFEVRGAVSLKLLGGPKPVIVVYKDGDEFKPTIPAKLERKGKSVKSYTPYEFTFGDKPAPGATACYVVEIPHYMISSPYCFKSEK